MNCEVPSNPGHCVILRSSSPAAPKWMANGNAVPTLPRGEGGKGDALRPAPPHLLCWEEAAVLLEAALTAPSLPTAAHRAERCAGMSREQQPGR